MVISSVLCPVDFSETSRAALHVAARVARQFSASLHVLFVEDPLLAAAANGAPARDLRDELHGFVAATPDLEAGVDPILHVAIGRPADVIVRFAQRSHASAIVMGTHGLTGVRKAFFGSTTARVLRRATTPLFMVPPLDGIDRARDLSGLGSILLLTDFGPAAAHAGRTAAWLADAVGAGLVLVHVMPRVPAPVSWDARAQAAMERRTTHVHQCMCRAMAPLEKFGPVESVIVEGNIAEEVATLARARHPGLIVMGLDAEEHGSRPGSTAYSVICSAPVPVLAIPAAPPRVPVRVRAARQEVMAGS